MLHSGFFAIFLVILAALWRTSAALEAIPHDRSCLPFQNRPLKLLCGGIYTSDIFLRYQDRLAVINSQYKIFYRNQGGTSFLLVSFNDSPLQCCNSSMLMDENLDIFCGDNQNPLPMPGSMIYCQIYQMSYIDDLMYECTSPRIRNFATVNGYTAVHYAAVSRWSAPQNEFEFDLGLRSGAERHLGPFLGRFLALLLKLDRLSK